MRIKMSFSIKKKARVTILMAYSHFLCQLVGISLAQTSDLSDLPFTHRYISSVAFSPDFNNDQTVFATVFHGGVFKSEDNGNTWFPINSGIENDYVREIVVSPNYAEDKTVFLLSAIALDNSTNTIFKSTDGGASWSAVRSQTGIRTFAVSPTFFSDSTLIAGTHQGKILRSTDAGRTWQQLPQSIFCPKAYTFSPNFNADSTLFCGNFGTGFSTVPGNIFKSIDGGLTWTKVDSQRVFSVNALAISPIFEIERTLFAGNGLGGITKSVDGGLTWEFSNTGLDQSDVGAIAISADFENDQTLFITTARGVYKSTDAGSSWTSANSGITDRNTECIAISPNYAVDQTVISGTHGVLFKSVDGGVSWFSVNDGIPLSELLNVSNSPDTIASLASIVVDDSGIAHIAYSGTYYSPEAPERLTTDIFYSSNQSGSFGKPQKVPVPAGFGHFSKFVHIGVDRNGFAHLAFVRAATLSSTPDRHIFYATNASGEWQSELVARSGQFGEFLAPSDPRIGVDSTETVHLTFESTGLRYTSKRSNDSFLSPQRVDDYSGFGYSMVVEPKGTVHIAYIKDGDISYRKGQAGVFSDKTIIRFDLGNEHTPAIDVDENGKAHIAFGRFSSTYYTSNAAVDTFSVPILVGTQVRATQPDIRIGPDGSINIAEESANFYVMTPNGFEKFEVTRIDNAPIAGRSFFDIDKDGVAHLVYQHTSNRITTLNIYEDIFYVRFLSAPPNSVEDSEPDKFPATFVLSQNYPNPFNPTTTIEYKISRNVHVKVAIYNLLGHLVATLVDEHMSAGIYSVQWNGQDDTGKNVASGVYLYRLETGDIAKVKKLVLVR